MNTSIKYVASSGHSYDLTVKGTLHRTANYYDWKWNVEGTQLQYGTRVSNFLREAAEYDAELVFYGEPEEIKTTISALHNDFEYDLRQNKPGRIILGKYHIDCFINQSGTDPFPTWKYVSNKIHIYAPYPFWVSDYNVTLPKAAASGSTFLDYPYDYPYDYTAPAVGIKNIKLDSPFSSEFRMVIYGQAVNPRITINGHPYVLYVTIPSGAYVIVDSRSKSIMQYNRDGTRSNMFNFRNKTDSIFEKVPGGNLLITWDSSFGVDLTIYQERSEPDFEVIA
jgi:hypothetical protein